MHPSLAQLFDLTDPVAIVTGATKGLGRSIASGLSRAGASVVVASRDQGRCDEVIGAALYLASNASSFATGEDHVVAGGMLRG